MINAKLDQKNTVVLVGVDFGLASFDKDLQELSQLATAAGLQPVASFVCKRKVQDASLFVGSGKAEEIAMLARANSAHEVLFDQSLSPSQQRNLEKALGLPVNDRTALILFIFAQRARSHEGKLQVELARLQYLSTRLVGRWSHLERQRGGIGSRGGPGESQIELDRRMISQAIARTRLQMFKLLRQRNTQRQRRLRNRVFSIALVGYTNAGKSSIFNALVKSKSLVANQLFATLDTTTRQIWLGYDVPCRVSLSDTVGFIRDLPHSLIEAFRATLQEATEANLLLHVVDASNLNYLEQIHQVQNVLEEIKAHKIPIILVFNKLDAISSDCTMQHLIKQRVDILELDGKSVPRIFVSARTGQGIDALRLLLSRQISKEKVFDIY